MKNASRHPITNFTILTIAMAMAVLFQACFGLGAAGGQTVAAPAPELVSPGRATLAEDRDELSSNMAPACPTFHWGAPLSHDDKVAVSQRIVAFEMLESPRGDVPSEEPVFEAKLPASARGYTLDASRCLAPGRYAWAIAVELAAGPDDSSELAWSEPFRFVVEQHGPNRDDKRIAAPHSGRDLDAPGVVNRSASDQASHTSMRRPGARASANGSAGTAPAAIRGESIEGPTSHGVAGATFSVGGAGVYATNQNGGADLILDGAANTETDTAITQSTLDRVSDTAESFNFTNSGSGSMTLNVDGEPVVTGDVVSSLATGWGLTGGGTGDVSVQADITTVQARVLDSCAAGSSIRAIDGQGNVVCETDDSGSLMAGNQLSLEGDTLNVVEGPDSDLDADTLDGLEASELALASHGHFGAAWSGSGANGLNLDNSSSSGGVSAIRATLSATTGGSFAAAVYGVNASTTGNGIGVLGTQSGSGWGVFGQTPNGRGVVGQSTTGSGVYGIANATSGLNHGVFALSNSTDGYGLFATGAGQAVHATSAHHTVAEFVSTDPNGGTAIDAIGRTAIMGQGDSTLLPQVSSVAGVQGSSGGLVSGQLGRRAELSDGTPIIYGVYGRVLGIFVGSIRRAGYFDGDVDVTGTLTKGGGSFLIDHPLDPENKTLSHSFVESPDMMNIYNGNVILDESGEAWVELPEWFDALNRDFRYQLTGIGSAAVLYVAEEIVGNQFKIAGGAPAMKVSWQVTGIRQDAWANENRIPVEAEKHPGLKGRFVHPEVRGLPAELGIHRVRQDAESESVTEDSTK